MIERTPETASGEPKPPGYLVTPDEPAGVGKTPVSELQPVRAHAQVST